MFSQDGSPADRTHPVPEAALEAALAPFGSSRMLPPEAYTSPDVFAWEQRNFFTGWQCAGFAADLDGPGAQRAEPVGSTSVLLVRGKDGVLRGFANTCRHRGHEILPCGGATTRRSVVCPYHAWSYTLEGDLFAAPGYDGAFDFDAAQFPLRALRVQEWHGYVFVDLSGQAPPLEEYLGALGDRLALHRPERLVVAARHTYVVRANWKTISENYQECYHCPEIHPELCAVSPPDSGENWYAPGAWVGGWMDIRPGMATMSLDGHSDGVLIPGLDEWSSTRVDYLGVFPNLLVSTHPDYVMTHRMAPLGPNRTWVECAWSFPVEATSRPGFDPAYAVDFWDVTNKQDWAACESVQRGMESGLASAGPLSPQEDGVYQFVTMVARGYAGQPVHVKPEAQPV
ncbi:aromatic ring-hydroxylating dioxygenase subunit alpha [Kineosporia sp. R_H_3]|uniref:aromatic ring-hydroxylating oxygenase subunit alpha n=1 Tax=Kineosporia sp. R_H_3 TaxID=1961848 RepID=UPI000B4B4ED3|nr:aromatic ring-hydroxylating dioxygenase subunit alpha [Kineosporia sp. R_H_3]